MAVGERGMRLKGDAVMIGEEACPQRGIAVCRVQDSFSMLAFEMGKSSMRFGKGGTL